MNLTPEQRAEIKALVDAATPGPWQYSKKRGEVGYRSTENDQSFGMFCPVLDVHCDTDGEFVSAAREAIPALLADLQEAERTISRQQTAIDGQVAEINTLKDDRNSLLANFFAKFNGEDQLESLVCPVVISPADLMTLQSALEAARREGIGLLRRHQTINHHMRCKNREELGVDYKGT